MELLRLVGGNRLSGRTKVGGAKNAVLPILAACLLTDDLIVLEGFPRLLDTLNMLKILEKLGCQCAVDGARAAIDPSSASNHEMPEELSKQLRSSIFMMGPMVGRFGRATVTYPGGCEIGLRPIDLHLKGLRALGVRIREAHGMIYLDGTHLSGGEVHLDFPSVGATENVMMAAVLAPGRTVIHNAAREPEIVDLQRFINRMGGRVQGAGSDQVVVDGVKKLHGAAFTPMPDRIVAATLLAAAAMTRGEIALEGVNPADLIAVLDKFRGAGCQVEAAGEQIFLRGPERLKAIEVSTQPFPGFPTDMQAQIMAMCCVAEGTSVIVENVFESRFSHASQLRCMGADISIHNRTAVVRGGSLTGARVSARDLRGGAALVLAGLAAEGVTEIDNVELIDRGYEAIEEQLKGLGASITRI